MKYFHFFFFVKPPPKLHLIHLYGVISYNCYNKVMQTEVKGHFSAKMLIFMPFDNCLYKHQCQRYSDGD